MHVRRFTGRRLAAPALALCVALVPGVAQAADTPWGESGEGDSKGGTKGGGGTIYAESKVQVRTSGGKRTTKSGELTPANSNWTPPACWYEPAFSPKEIEATVKAFRTLENLPIIGGFGKLAGDVLDHRYKDGHPYKDYNRDKQGKGMFWAAVKNKNRLDDPEVNSCDRQPFWVDDNDTPDVPMAVSPKILAEYAYDELPIPGTEIELAPEGETKVNLPTWAWLDRAKFKKVSVTASLPDTNISATTTARPVSLRIEPGTKDAETYPASGECPIGKDGSIGEPWTRGKGKQAPPCGVKYLRSSGDGSYDLKATVTWEISWTGTGSAGERLPDGEFGADQRVVVKEIQSINR
ncbi:hypothetical protein [Streptomyces sp. G45]|uniref:hypothetical protein n=1 Tax=Streptomyces sp. G45 TaxID=3406627 RepID=UPI003C1B0CB6